MMRAQVFLDYLRDYDFLKVTQLLGRGNKIKGWEGWFQVEIAYYLLNKQGVTDVEREKRYPNVLDLCDLFLSRNDGQRDETYVEIKCINPTVNNPQNDAYNRFTDDVNKIRRIRKIQGNQTLNGIAVLATFDSPTNLFLNLGNLQVINEEKIYILNPGNSTVTLDSQNSNITQNLYLIAYAG